MNEPRSIPFARPWIDETDRQAVLDVLNGHILTHGPKCHEFEERFATFMGDDAHCVSMSSCMAALHMAYFYYRIGPGDEVIVPAQTHTATVHAVDLVGATPVFVDCEPETGNIDPNQIERYITSRTKAISLVHFVGIPCDMDQILDIAHRHGLKIIEDCAIAIGARYKGRHVGVLGDVGCFSFYPVKHMTTGEGGMFVSHHPEVAQSVARQRAFGVDRKHTERKVPGMYDVVELGLNYRMSEMQAALGCTQTAKLDAILKIRATNFKRLRSGLAGIPHIRILQSANPSIQSSHYCLSLILDGPLADKRDTVLARLNADGVGTSIYYPHPVPSMSYYRAKYGYDVAAYPNATAISDQSIALPVGPHLTVEDMNYIAQRCQTCINESLA
jgi:dTDP-4-amino-4,6-dideoxygalactose transaminase